MHIMITVYNYVGPYNIIFFFFVFRENSEMVLTTNKYYTNRIPNSHSHYVPRVF